jgi:hypothetical protein
MFINASLHYSVSWSHCQMPTCFYVENILFCIMEWFAINRGKLWQTFYCMQQWNKWLYYNCIAFIYLFCFCMVNHYLSTSMINCAAWITRDLTLYKKYVHLHVVHMVIHRIFVPQANKWQKDRPNALVYAISLKLHTIYIIGTGTYFMEPGLAWAVCQAA